MTTNRGPVLTVVRNDGTTITWSGEASAPGEMEGYIRFGSGSPVEPLDYATLYATLFGEVDAENIDAEKPA